MNPDLDKLQPYPFKKLELLLKDIQPAGLSAVSLSVGEPRHPAPQCVLDAIINGLGKLENYPGTRGSDDLRQAMAHWIGHRFKVTNTSIIAQQHVIPVNGTREGLFAIAQCVLNRTATDRCVLMPNPFYQIYEGAALLAGCQPEYYAIDENADANLAAITDEQFKRCQLIFVCTPGNPTGAVNSQASLQWLIEKAHEHNFIIVSDECYSEIYREKCGPPCGLLQAAAAMGLDTFLISQFVQYRTYQGCAMSGTVQQASIAAWSDEAHVQSNRAEYDRKYEAVLSILETALPLKIPAAGFYLWPHLPVDDQKFTQRLLADYNVRAVPGSYLATGSTTQGNPGTDRLRLALVAPLDDCITASKRIVECLDSY